MNLYNQEKTNEEVLEQTDQNQGSLHSLILYNDDVHNFEYVIESLIKVCRHDLEQATQCTYLVHFKGKCDVKKGSLAFLKPMQDALISRDLRATID